MLGQKLGDPIRLPAVSESLFTNSGTRSFIMCHIVLDMHSVDCSSYILSEKYLEWFK